jgi:hypothetical protein
MSGMNGYVIGDEARVVAAFCQWLTQHGAHAPDPTG